MTKVSQYLGDTPLDERAARRRALEWIRAALGQTPYVAKIERVEGVWRVRIDAELPKVLFNPTTDKPDHALYYHFSDIGYLAVDAHNGEIVQKPDFWSVHKRIEEEMSGLKAGLEKALTKAAAVEFSRLPFGEHMHTPLYTILTWLLMEQEFKFKEQRMVDLGGVPIKLEDYLERLEKVGLVRLEGTTALPGNELVSIFAQKKPDHERIRDAMAFFFARGFNDIDSIRQVLGPYLRMGRIIYEDSVEVGKLTPLSYATVKQKIIETSYGRQKEFSVPRYLMQLSEVGIIMSPATNGARSYQPVPALFERVLAQEELLEPIRNSIARSAGP